MIACAHNGGFCDVHHSASRAHPGNSAPPQASGHRHHGGAAEWHNNPPHARPAHEAHIAKGRAAVHAEKQCGGGCGLRLRTWRSARLPAATAAANNSSAKACTCCKGRVISGYCECIKSHSGAAVEEDARSQSTQLYWRRVNCAHSSLQRCHSASGARHACLPSRDLRRPNLHALHATSSRIPAHNAGVTQRKTDSNGRSHWQIIWRQRRSRGVEQSHSHHARVQGPVGEAVKRHSGERGDGAQRRICGYNGAIASQPSGVN